MSRRIAVSSQRAALIKFTVDGDSFPPPSTIAAQIVKNQAPEQLNQDPQNKELFGKLLQDYLQDPSSEDVNLSLSSQLIAVVCKAGLDVLFEDNPFSSHTAEPQAIDSLSVIQLTVQKTPRLLFYEEQGEIDVQNPPLLVWLFPKLLALLGLAQFKRVQESVQRLLTVCLRITTKLADAYRNALAIIGLYQACIDGTLFVVSLKTLYRSPCFRCCQGTGSIGFVCKRLEHFLGSRPSIGGNDFETMAFRQTARCAS